VVPTGRPGHGLVLIAFFIDELELTEAHPPTALPWLMDPVRFARGGPDGYEVEEWRPFAVDGDSAIYLRVNSQGHGGRHRGPSPSR